MKNRFSASLQHDGLWMRLFFLLGTIAVGLLVTIACSFICLQFSGSLIGGTTMLRVIQFVQSMSIFLMPAIVMGYCISGHPWKYLQLNRWPSGAQVLLTIVSMVVMAPFMNQIITWNESIKLPESMSAIEMWMREKETTAADTIALILNTSSWGVRVINLFLVGVVAAVTEELFFRGMLQNIFLDKWHKKLLAVLLSAFIFSAIHFQFYGFVPRFLLGAYFGLLLVWTGTLWIPILAHFINNMLALIQYYIEQAPQGKLMVEELETYLSITWMAILFCIISLMLFLCVAFFIKKSGRR